MCDPTIAAAAQKVHEGSIALQGAFIKFRESHKADLEPHHRFILIEIAISKIHTLVLPGSGLVYDKRLLVTEHKAVIRSLVALDKVVRALACAFVGLDGLNDNIVRDVQVMLLLLDGDDQRHSSENQVFAIGLIYYFDVQADRYVDVRRLRRMTLGFRFSSEWYDTVPWERFDEIDSRIGWSALIIGTKCSDIWCHRHGAMTINKTHRHDDKCPPCGGNA